MTWFCELMSDVHLPPLPFKGNTLPPVLTGVDNIQKYSTSCSTNSPTHTVLKKCRWASPRHHPTFSFMAPRKCPLVSPFQAQRGLDPVPGSKLLLR